MGGAGLAYPPCGGGVPAVSKEVKKKRFALWLAGLVLLTGVACKKQQTTDLTVYMPDGAPALAMSKLLCEDTATDGVSYFVVPPAKIATVVSYNDMQKNADICVLPLTVATKKLGAGDKYRMLGTVTRGNLYILGREQASYTKENISALIGKRVGVVQLSEVPGLTLKAVLTGLGVPWQELKEGVALRADVVNLQSLTGADAIDKSATLDFWVAGEPAVSLHTSKGLYRVGDLQALYGDGYTQAVLVAKASILSSKAEWLQSFLDGVRAGGEWVLNTNATTLVSAVTAHLEDKNGATTLKAPLLTREALEHCGIEFRASAVCKAETQAFLRALQSVNVGVALASDAFYYGAE